jgi:hypothetical protein
MQADSMPHDTAASHPRGPQHPIRPRKVPLPFGPEIPRYWFFGSPLGTHIVNSLNLLFPHGERLFVKSVKACMDQIDDPELLAQVRGFIGQESRHGLEHERFFEVLEAQGFHIRRFLWWFELVTGRIIHRIAPKTLSLAATAAAEHYTAVLADMALRDRMLDDNAHPIMRDLFLWHAAEEIEHKAVAFDVLQKVDDSYAVRVAGFALASACLLSFWAIGAVMLMAQDDEATWERIRRDYRGGREGGFFGRPGVVRRVMAFTRPGFHPWNKDNLELAMSYLARAKVSAASA